MKKFMLTLVAGALFWPGLCRATTTTPRPDTYLDIKLQGINPTTVYSSVATMESDLSAASVILSIGNASASGGTAPSGTGIVDAEIDGNQNNVLLGYTANPSYIFAHEFSIPALLASEYIFPQAPGNISVLEPGFNSVTLSTTSSITIPLAPFSTTATGTSFSALSGQLPFIYLPDHSVIGVCFYSTDGTGYQLYLCRVSSNARGTFYRAATSATSPQAPVVAQKITFAQNAFPLLGNPVYYLGY